MKTVTEINRKLDTCRAELGLAQSELERVNALEGSAVDSTAGYSTWRTEHGQAQAEVQRLSRLVGDLEATFAKRQAEEDQQGLLLRISKVRKASEKLAARITEDGAKIESLALDLIREVATLDREIAELNGRLPEGVDVIVGPDFIARGVPARQKKVLSEKKTWLWTFAETGNLVGDQSAVRSANGVSGVIEAGTASSYTTQCILRQFTEVTYHERAGPVIAKPIWQMVLPSFGSASVVYDGERVSSAREALQLLERKQQRPSKPEREVLIEYVPIGTNAAMQTAEEA